MERIITVMLSVTAIMAIRTIGRVPESSPSDLGLNNMRLAKKNSRFILFLLLRFLHNYTYFGKKSFLKVLKGNKIPVFIILILQLEVVSGLSLSDTLKFNESIRVGAERTELYLPLLKNRRIALVANQTSVVNSTHLVDTLLSLGIKIRCVFAPEHGFRGQADAGEHISSRKDERTGLPLISLYGENKKPGRKELDSVDIVVFDIQDVGARFYTYISTMHYVMEACAERGVEFLVVDGPVLNPGFSSFVGMHPVPIVHGMTMAEYAYMINGELWLKGKVQCRLFHIPVENYSHSDLTYVKVNPSPNLRDMAAIFLYPSLCLFEGTVVSVGRGTDKPFRIIGYPGNQTGSYTFTPKSTEGAKKPPYEGQLCKGLDLSGAYKDILKHRQLNLSWLISFYSGAKEKEKFFNSFIDKLAGGDDLKKAIIAGKKEEEIRAEWRPGLERFKMIRKKYLLYPERLQP
jgi:uncharacterized protein YbbC (DUF1343 family)